MRGNNVARCAVLLGLVTACAGSEPVKRIQWPPLSEADAALFDDGVDLMEDPEGLEGRWRDDWEQELESRVERADEIVVGVVRTVRVDTDLARKTRYRVAFDVERVSKGTPAEDLMLSSDDGAAGYASMARNKDRLLGRRFVAFIKRASDDISPDAPHFHLTPASAPVQRQLDAYEASLRPNTIKVIEHDQGRP